MLNEKIVIGRAKSIVSWFRHPGDMVYNPLVLRKGQRKRRGIYNELKEEDGKTGI